MTTFPNSPRLVKGGIVLIDADTSVVQRIIVLQYNSDTLTRTLQMQGAGGEGGSSSEALRLTGPPIETIKLEAEIDATDQLEFPDQNRVAKKYGIHPQLAALETILYPLSSDIKQANILAQKGTIEIAPAESPLALFVWSKNRVMPVRITEFSIVEEAFDPSLNPIRARISLGMRVLTVNDLGFDRTGGNLFMSYHEQKERLAAMSPGGDLSTLGIGGML